MSLLVNFLAFQIGWFSSVIGAAQQMPWAGPAVFLVIFAVHLRQALRPWLEVYLVVVSGMIGIFFESMLVALGWVTYPSGMFSESLAPYWIVTMWMLFATTLNVSLGWLKGRPWLAALLGLVGGPASYFAGSRLGGIQFLDFGAAMAALGAGWALSMPVLVRLAQRFDGFSAELRLAGFRK